jgi:hypothetical protein
MTSKQLQENHWGQSSDDASAETNERGDWLDEVCEKATTICPVPNDVPAEAFEQVPNDEEDVLDHVFGGIERTLSLRTSGRLEKAVKQRELEDEHIEYGPCGPTVGIEEDGEEDLDSIMERTAQHEDKDALDRVFDNVESMTCGGSGLSSTIPSVPYIKKKDPAPTIKEDEYVTRADLESDGVRFRDGQSLVEPEKPISPRMHFVILKEEHRSRWTIWVAAGILALILIIIGAVLLGTGL